MILERRQLRGEVRLGSRCEYVDSDSGGGGHGPGESRSSLTTEQNAVSRPGSDVVLCPGPSSRHAALSRTICLSPRAVIGADNALSTGA